MQVQLVRGLHLHRHIREAEADGLVLGDRLAEGDALLRVLDTELERPQASPPTDPPFPVAQAINDWNDGRHPIEWVTGCYGLAVIRMEENR